MERDIAVTTNRGVKAQLLDEIEHRKQIDKREDLISIRHRLRGIAQDLTFLKLRSPGLEEAVQHIEKAQRILELQVKPFKQ